MFTDQMLLKDVPESVTNEPSFLEAISMNLVMFRPMRKVRTSGL